MRNVVLYSGGVDSFLVHQHLKSKKIDHSLIYFDLGGKYSKCERDLFNSDGFQTWVHEPVQVCSNLMMGNLEDETAYIPNRNVLAAIMAHSVADADMIYIGGTLSDRVNDNNPLIFEKVSNLLSILHNKRITVMSPFFDIHKPGLVKKFVDSNGFSNFENSDQAKYSLVESTFSCYYPDKEDEFYHIKFLNKGETSKIVEVKDNACLECPACFRKNMSLFAGGIFISMWNTEKAIETVKHYFDEAMLHIHEKSDPMFDRYYWTIKYCNAVAHHLGISLKDCSCQ